MFDIFFISKVLDHPEYIKLKLKYPFIKLADDFTKAQKKALTEFFWVVWDDVLVLDTFDFTYVPDSWSSTYIHTFLNRDFRDGVLLVPKKSEPTLDEITSRFFVNRKDIDIVASIPKPYDIFVISTYEDYVTATTRASTPFFWMVKDDALVQKIPKLFYISHNDTYEQSQNHAFFETSNGTYNFLNMWLVARVNSLTPIEIKNNLLNEYESHYDLTQRLYDVVFISYNEPNADQNYKKLLSKVPYAKRVSNVTGIHQAHIAAAKLCNTEMFWVVDGDAEIVDTFSFNYVVPKWDKDIVHVWRSKNPINDLEYGYGGVKLLPTKMTLNMDVTRTDMTTSISSKFKAIKEVSNITKFNTDPYNTWRSAFRESCKLSSRVIDRQKLDETDDRLKIWCTVGKDRPFGEYAISGARAGMQYGIENQKSPSKLRLINDFNWLKDQFNDANT